MNAHDQLERQLRASIAERAPAPTHGPGRRHTGPSRLSTLLIATTSLVALGVVLIALFSLGHSRSSSTRSRMPGGAPSTHRTSPPASPLVALHHEAGEILGGDAKLMRRIRSLRGYPVVINVWASWCPACREQNRMLASASSRYGRHVAFLGLDLADQGHRARTSFAHDHPDYPSYTARRASQLTPLLSQHIRALPTTLYIDRAGHVIRTQSGAYLSNRQLNRALTALTTRPARSRH